MVCFDVPNYFFCKVFAWLVLLGEKGLDLGEGSGLRDGVWRKKKDLCQKKNEMC